MGALGLSYPSLEPFLQPYCHRDNPGRCLELTRRGLKQGDQRRQLEALGKEIGQPRQELWNQVEGAIPLGGLWRSVCAAEPAGSAFVSPIL